MLKQRELLTPSSQFLPRSCKRLQEVVAINEVDSGHSAHAPTNQLRDGKNMVYMLSSGYEQSWVPLKHFIRNIKCTLVNYFFMSRSDRSLKTYRHLNTYLSCSEGTHYSSKLKFAVICILFIAILNYLSDLLVRGKERLPSQDCSHGRLFNCLPPLQGRRWRGPWRASKQTRFPLMRLRSFNIDVNLGNSRSTSW